MVERTTPTAALGADQRGAIFVESLIAYLPCLYFALCVWQLTELCMGQLLVQRAANAAIRAAVVTVPDNVKLYDNDPVRQAADIELAAALVLVSDPNFIHKPKVTLNDRTEFLKLNETPRRGETTRLLEKLLGWASVQTRPWLTQLYFMQGSRETGLINELVTARVEADFECYLSWINVVCGGDRMRLSARATLPFQGAAYDY